MELNKIYNEDCLITMKDNIDKNCVNVILTSPPYNMTKRKGGYADKQKRYDEYEDWKNEDEYVKWTINIFNSFNNILKENGVVLYNFSYSIENPSLPYRIVCEILNNTEFTIADTIVWKKGTAIPHPASYNRLNRIYEFVYVFCRKKELLTFETNKEVVKTSPKGQNYYEIIDNFIIARNNDGSNPYNKATYSTELCDKLLGIYAKDKSIVYDPFMGTGTSAMSCLKRDLKYIGSELSLNQIEYFNERLLNKQIQKELEEEKKKIKLLKLKEKQDRELEKQKKLNNKKIKVEDK
jgi:site-specific DNA-methyltransferase (adenine-specific)/modification methylase